MVAAPVPVLVAWSMPRRGSFNHTAVLRRAGDLFAERLSFDRHWSKALGAMLEPLGIPLDDVRRGTSFYCSPEAREYARDFVADKQAPLVAFSLGAGTSDKRWAVENFVALAREICARYGYAPLVFTNPGMEVLARKFVRQYGGGAVVASPLSLDWVGALMQECAYVVAADTSLMHMAFGLKRPTLVLFSFVRPEMVMPEDCPVEACIVESATG